MTETDDTVLGAARDVVRREAAGVAAVADQIDGSFLEVARLLRDCVGKVFVAGAGTSGSIARRMAHLFSVCGTPSVFLPPADALHGTMGAVTDGDIVIAISKGGESAEVNELTSRAKDRGATVVALTASSDSGLACRADLVVQIVPAADTDPGGVIAMGSTLETAVWGDALAVVLMRLRGYDWGSVLHSHPSGAVGQMSDVPPPLEPLQLSSADGTRR